jgi:hypothetical protein
VLKVARDVGSLLDVRAEIAECCKTFRAPRIRV